MSVLMPNKKHPPLSPFTRQSFDSRKLTEVGSDFTLGKLLSAFLKIGDLKHLLLFPKLSFFTWIVLYFSKSINKDRIPGLSSRLNVLLLQFLIITTTNFITGNGVEKLVAFRTVCNQCKSVLKKIQKQQGSICPCQI